ncbi:TonB-dependent receptor domain-containing protein [Puia sp. P3]|uniref:TonB-dependent receptor domain-containing protein n=1 Tax=Puia sp. P3 TaxID=3423952 RepID=UPI003D66CA5A
MGDLPLRKRRLAHRPGEVHAVATDRLRVEAARRIRPHRSQRLPDHLGPSQLVHPWQQVVNASSAYYPFGNVFTSGPASSIQALANPNIEWETTKQLNFGVDLGLLGNSVTVSAEYFRRKTDNLILRLSAAPLTRLPDQQRTGQRRFHEQQRLRAPGRL